MKTFIVSCVALCVMVVLSDAHQYDDEYQKFIVECLIEMKLTKEDFIKMADDEDGKVSCVLACANKKYKLFDGTKFNAERINELAEKALVKKQIEYTADKKTKMQKCIESGNGTDEDECKKTDVFLKCLFQDDELVKIFETNEELAKTKEEMKEINMSAEGVKSMIPA